MTFQPRVDPAEVVALNAAGLRQKEIAKRVGITQSSVCRLLQRNNAKSFLEPGPPRIYALNEEYFATIDTPEKAYWLGFLAADGHINARGGTLQVRLGGGDIEHLRLLASALGSEAKPKIGKDGAADIRLHSRLLVAGLITHGVTQRKTWACAPWDAPVGLAPHYWRGLIDGDGHIRVGANTRDMMIVFVGTREMVEGFRSYAAEVCGTTAVLREQVGCWRFSITGHRQIHVLLSALYREDWVALERKKKAALSIIAEPYTPLRFRKSCRICGDPAVARLLCKKHWQRWRANGDPLVTRRGRGPDGKFRTAA